MIVDIAPSRVTGSITPPSSKSFLHRAIISACLSKGTSTIENVVYSVDVQATLEAFSSLGVNINRDGSVITIDSPGPTILNQKIDVNCHESGSTLRFLFPILSNDDYAYFKGNASLLSRPMKVYEEIFKSQNLKVIKEPKQWITKGRLSPGIYRVPGDISSQFVSGLMFILPILGGDSTIEIVGDLESSEYVDLTINILSLFGIKITKKGNSYFIQGNQVYLPAHVISEIDYSQSAFFAVLGIINNDLDIYGLNLNSVQPDRRIFSFIKDMKGNIDANIDCVRVKKSNTTASIIDVSQSPDIAPILAILAAKSEGETKIINAKRLIIKESNRLLSTYETLCRLGVETTLGDDWLSIKGPCNFKGGTFDSFNDHRIAMSIAIAATVADSNITITNAEAVNKSYPDFYKDLQSLGAVIKYR